MTQSMISFITSNTPVGGMLPTEYRVFDAEITNASAAFYNAQIQTIEDYYNGVSGVTKEAAMNALKDLYLWSGFKYVDESGVQQTRANAKAFVVNSNPPPAVIESTTGPDINFIPSRETGGTSDTVLTTTMDRYMAQGLENIINTLRAAGFNINSGTAEEFESAITAVRPVTSGSTTVDIYGFAALLAAAINAVSKAILVDDPITDPVLLRQKLLERSEQQMLQVDYVARGNQILAEEMSQLNNAINGNDTALSFLNGLQDLFNQKDPEKFALQLSFLTSNSPQYQDYEKQTYSRTLGTVSKFGADQQALQDYLAAHKGSDAPFASQAFLDNLLHPELDPDPNNRAFTASKTRLVNNLGAMADYIQTTSGGTATNLVNALRTIQNDLANSPTLTLQAWVQDIQTGIEGDYQRHISQAITASQSFNDTAREKLSNVMFVFQEFYQSASSILTTIGSLADKIFSYIGR